MKIKKRYIILLIVTVLIGWKILLFGLKMYTYPPKISNYNPTTFSLNITKPMIFREGKNLFYCKENQSELKTNLIYTLKDIPKYNQWDIAVSPNSEYIAIKDDNELFVIDKEGKNKTKIGDCKSMLSFEFEKDKIRWKNLQWSADSRYILIIKDKKGENGRVVLNEILLYDLTEKELKRIGESVNVWEAYFDKRNQYVYYSFWENKKEKVQRFSLELKEKGQSDYSFIDSTLFMNFTPYDLQNHRWDMKSVVVDSWGMGMYDDLEDGIYLYSEDTIQLIMKSSLSEKSLKGRMSNNHHKHASYFLPGGRFYLFDNWSREYDGYLIIDTENMAYSEVGNDIQFYFSLTTENVKAIHEGKPKYLYEFSRRTDRLIYDPKRQTILK
jgi:hypothetical protein